MTKIGFRRAIGLLALASGVSSCTIIDPHRTTIGSEERDEIILESQRGCLEIDPKTGRVDTSKIPADAKGMSPYCQFYGQLPAAIAYAYAQSEEFDGAVSSQSVLKNGIALGVIPAAAAGLFLGINGGSSEAILGLASGGAAALGLGSFLVSEPRQRVYLSGSLALGCSILKAAPYLMDQDQHRAIGSDFTDVQARLENNILKATDLKAQLVGFDQQIARLVAQIKVQEGSYDPGDTSYIQQATDSSITVARQALADAGAMIPKVLAARMKVDQASIALVQSVHDIAEQVSREVTKTEPDINTIRALASQIAPGVQAQLLGYDAARKALGPAPATPPKTTEGLLGSAGSPDAASSRSLLESQAEELASARNKVTWALQKTLEEIDGDTHSLRQSLILVEPLIQSIAAREQTAAAVPACIVEAAEVGFTMSPPVTEMPLKVGETKGLIINGAVGNADGTIVNGKSGGIEFKTTGSGTGLLVSMTGKTPGTYVVAIFDSTGKGTKTINVTVETGLTLKIGDKVVGETFEIAKATDTKIDIAGGSGALSTLVPGSQTDLTVSAPTGDAAKGSVTINPKGAGPYSLTIKAGEEQRTIAITVKK
jgi:hypothetical protein